MVSVYLFVLGTCVGSFLNVLIDRLPKDASIMGRSHCDHCKKTLQPLDLIPIVSFFTLKGRCRYCRKKLSYVYPLVELLTGVAFVLTWIYVPAMGIPVKILYLAIVLCLITIFFADLKYQIIPDQIQIILLLFSLLAVRMNEVRSGVPLLTDGLFVMTPLLLLFLLTKGKGMGFGDVKLSFIAGILLGVFKGFLALYVAFVAGALYGIVLVAAKRKKLKSKVAFGPFIILGMTVMIFWGEFLRYLIQMWYRF